MELGSSFLFLQEQIKDIIIITAVPRGGRGIVCVSLWRHVHLGWRIHCGVEVTELSTNKHNTHYERRYLWQKKQSSHRVGGEQKKMWISARVWAGCTA